MTDDAVSHGWPAVFPKGRKKPLRKKVGVFGGTFNPIHTGHLQVAGVLKSLFGLTQIHFVVAAEPPHKSPEGIAPLIHRFAMVSLATSSFPGFIPSLIELEPPPSPFSLDTMNKLARRCNMPGGDLFFIAGGDSLLEVRDWHRSEELLKSFSFIFVARPGFDVGLPPTGLSPEAISRCRDLTEAARCGMPSRLLRDSMKQRPGIFLVDIGAPDIAASRIRSLAAAGKKYRHLVPDVVYEYIRKLHLYGER